VDQNSTTPNAQEHHTVQSGTGAELQHYIRVLINLNSMEVFARLSVNCSTRRSPPRSQRRLNAETSPRTVGVEQNSTTPDALEEFAQDGHGVVIHLLTRKINKLMVNSTPLRDATLPRN